MLRGPDNRYIMKQAKYINVLITYYTRLHVCTGTVMSEIAVILNTLIIFNSHKFMSRSRF